MPSHDPNIIALITANNGVLVLLIQVDNPVVGFDRPNKLHAPHRIALTIAHKAAGTVGFFLAIQSTGIKSKGRGDTTVHIEPIGFNWIVGVDLEKRRYAGYHIPIAHKAWQIDRRNGLQRWRRTAT